MSKKSVVWGGVAIMLLLLIGCKKPNKLCEEEKLTAAFVFDYPDTVQVGQAFNLNVEYVVDNSCGEFGRFEAERIDNSLEVKLKASYSGCNCAEELENKSVNYPIIFEDPATYALKFWVAENQYETYVIVAE